MQEWQEVVRGKGGGAKELAKRTHIINRKKSHQMTRTKRTHKNTHKQNSQTILQNELAKWTKKIMHKKNSRHDMQINSQKYLTRNLTEITAKIHHNNSQTWHTNELTNEPTNIVHNKSMYTNCQETLFATKVACVVNIHVRNAHAHNKLKTKPLFSLHIADTCVKHAGVNQFEFKHPYKT